MKFTSDIIRKDFIDFFLSKKHKFIKSSSVFPLDDPTLLFINAGMNQFKNIFLGIESIQNTRVVNSQKCIRVSGKHNDLEEVGLDKFHHTFFEMLGNWSFNDFYKKEIIMWSWELLTDVWKLDKNRLWVTVYKDDDEALDLWIKNTDIKPERVLKFGDKENFWEMGSIGPCGPCSEIHYYTGKDLSKQNSNGVNVLDEYRELWNLVFIQYNRIDDGSLEELPMKHIDTGMGLERILSTLNHNDDHYLTDLFLPLINKIEKISGIKYSDSDGMAHRVIADHIRMITFSISDGIMPSNEGRGYVVRRVLRRASRFGRVLKINEPFLYKIVDSLCEVLGESYSELIDKKQHVINVIQKEEATFGKTLDRGLTLINEIMDSQNNKIISGEDVFKLYDTFGFPIDLTELIAKENGFDIDRNSFDDFMNEQRERARGSHNFKSNSNLEDWIVLLDMEGSEFNGYQDYKCDSKIVKYRLKDKKIEVVLDKTPFYAESGGQIGDTGYIKSERIHLDVIDTYKIGNDICHLCKIVDGDIKEGIDNNFIAEIDSQRRNKIRSNHTATHLLHKALKLVLGEHVQQSGSLVSNEKLRFDLTHYEKLSQNQIEKIEDKVNQSIINNIKLDVLDKKYSEAKKMGAEALFGEKYGDVVRVVNIGDFSMELCGGTHVNRTGDISLFKIVSESALASGIRRIEAITGLEAIAYCNANINDMNTIKNKLQCNSEDVLNKLDGLLALAKENNKLLDKIEETHIYDMINTLEIIEKRDEFTFYRSTVNHSIKIKSFIDKLYLNHNKRTVLMLELKLEKPILGLVLSKDISENLNAGKIIQNIAKEFESGGGGPKHFGTSEFRNLNSFDKAKNSLTSYIKEIKFEK